jgi:hypothetical protein
MLFQAVEPRPVLIFCHITNGARRLFVTRNPRPPAFWSSFGPGIRLAGAPPIKGEAPARRLLSNLAYRSPPSERSKTRAYAYDCQGSPTVPGSFTHQRPSDMRGAALDRHGLFAALGPVPGQYSLTTAILCVFDGGTGGTPVEPVFQPFRRFLYKQTWEGPIHRAGKLCANLLQH